MRSRFIGIGLAMLVSVGYVLGDGVRPVHLFILSGQSNMAGMKPEAGLLPEAKALFPDANVVHVKMALGGQPIRHWTRNWDALAATNGIDPAVVAALRGKDKVKADDFYGRVLSLAQVAIKKHSRPTSIAFCWMQGERDAREKLSAAYRPAMEGLIARLRSDLKRPDMVAVIGRLSDCGSGRAEWDAIRDVQVAIAEADPLCAWVDTDDLNDKEANGTTRNDLHYTRDGYALFGRRLARQAALLIAGKEPAADGKPGEMVTPADAGR